MKIGTAWPDRQRAVRHGIAWVLAASLAARASVRAEDCFDFGASPAPAPSAHASGITSDDFNRCELADFWTLVDPLGNTSLRSAGVGSGDARLVVAVPQGSEHNPWPSNTAPRLLQPANDVDFGIEAKFASALTQSIQGHGLRVEDTAGNFLRFDLFFSSGSVRAFAGDTTATFINVAVGTTAPAYLRVIRTGSSWTFAHSANGTTWTNAGSFTYTFPQAVDAVGFHVINAAATPPAYAAAIDYFHNVAEPLADEDVPEPYSCTDVGGTPAPEPSGHPSGITSDDFNRCDIAGFWTFVSPLADAQLAMIGVGSGDARLLLTLPGGVRHDPASGNLAPRLMQSANNTNFAVEAKFDSLVFDTIQGHGLRAEDSAGNFLRFDIFAQDGVTRAFVGGTAGTFLNVALAGTPAYLRMSRTGTSWSFLHSTDGETWTTATTITFTFPGALAAVGFEALNSIPNNPGYTLAVDYFFNVSDPLADEDVPAAPPVEQFALDVSVAAGSGSVDISPLQALYDDGDNVTLTAIPAIGFEFIGWGGDASGTQNPLAIVMDQDREITASFAAIPETFVLDVTVVAGSGEVHIVPEKASYNDGELVTLTAAPAAGFAFAGWAGDASGTDNPLTIVMDQDRSVTASFTAIPVAFVLDVIVIAGKGEVVIEPEKATYTRGEVVTLTAMPGAGFELKRWGEDASGAENPIRVTMNADLVVTCEFTRLRHRDSDGDGVPDSKDKCPGSDIRRTVHIDGCDTGIRNVFIRNGCTLADVLESDLGCIKLKNRKKVVSALRKLSHLVLHDHLVRKCGVPKKKVARLLACLRKLLR